MTKKLISKVSKVSIDPNLAGTLFFMIFGLLFFIFIKLIGLLPMIRASFFSMLVSIVFVLVEFAILGRIFANALAKKDASWLRLLCMGFILAVLALLIACFGLFISSWIFDTEIFRLVHVWYDYVFIYASLTLIFSILIGIWFVPLTIIAVFYFNKSFYPRLLSFTETSLPN